MRAQDQGRAVAVVMNMFYTGLGIARSLGERGIPVIGLSAQRGLYGNFTRHARTLAAPDSREEPEALLAFLLRLGAEIGRGVLFPTRDDDLVFLDRFRTELAPFFSLVMPDSAVLRVCLDKWETALAAERAGVSTPRSWTIESRADFARVAAEVTYPCVLKPVAAWQWRQAKNWELVGARKAIGIGSEQELAAEYAAIARADERALVQEMVPGGDECLVIAACYMDRERRFAAGFNTRKLVQIPEGFGTGCIVQAVDRPELFAPAVRLLEAIGFTGIAEVEFKWDAARGEYRLIEINPRPWDQHRLGKGAGADLAYVAYCDHAGVEPAPMRRASGGQKWIAEDAFIMAALRLLRRRDPQLRVLFRMAQGPRTYAIWSTADPLPGLVYLATGLAPQLWRSAVWAVEQVWKRLLPSAAAAAELKKEGSHG